MITLTELILAIGFLADADLPNLKPTEVACLAQNIYHEARGESVLGQKAVAHVTLNRASDERWPDTICGVVHQDQQFSWTDAPVKINDPVAYENAMMIAVAAMSGLSTDPTDGATYFYNSRKASPRWSRRFATVAVIGGHRFLR